MINNKCRKLYKVIISGFVTNFFLIVNNFIHKVACRLILIFTLFLTALIFVSNFIVLLIYIVKSLIFCSPLYMNIVLTLVFKLFYDFITVFLQTNTLQLFYKNTNSRFFIRTNYVRLRWPKSVGRITLIRSREGQMRTILSFFLHGQLRTIICLASEKLRTFQSRLPT